MTYPQLLATVRRGNHVPLQCVQAVLSAAGKTDADFIRDLFSGVPHAKVGDPCSSCAGRLKILNSRIVGGRRIQYIGCGSCGHRPIRNKVIGPVVRATLVAKRDSAQV